MAKSAKKKSIKARLESQLVRLKNDLSMAEKESTKAKLAYQIGKIERELEIERIHKITKFRSVGVKEISGGAVGLGKRK